MNVNILWNYVKKKKKSWRYEREVEKKKLYK